MLGSREKMVIWCKWNGEICRENICTKAWVVKKRAKKKDFGRVWKQEIGSSSFCCQTHHKYLQGPPAISPPSTTMSLLHLFHSHSHFLGYLMRLCAVDVSMLGAFGKTMWKSFSRNLAQFTNSVANQHPKW